MEGFEFWKENDVSPGAVPGTFNRWTGMRIQSLNHKLVADYNYTATDGMSTNVGAGWSNIGYDFDMYDYALVINNEPAKMLLIENRNYSSGFNGVNTGKKTINMKLYRKLANAAPVIILNTNDNQTLYENDTFKIDGSAKETDVGDIVNVYYRINGGTARAIATGISTGASIPFNEQLTFKGGILYKGDTAITGALAEGPAHKLEVWAEDNQGGKSTVHERTFYVVPNRAPSLTIDPFDSQSEMINNDTITISGTSSDPDGNDVSVAYKLNTNAAIQIQSGVAGPWTFDLQLKDLKDGENTIVVEVTDTYDFKSSKTIKLNKHANLTPLEQSVQRYKITPPSGSAQGVLLWVQRDKAQEITAEISMTTGSEQEQFVPLPLENSGPVGEDVEDYFKYRADSPAENIILKLSWTGDKPITLISGALIQ